MLHRPAGAGGVHVGPGAVYRFLMTGAETAGAYFAMEALVAPGGGPPPHVHSFEDESLYVLDGTCTVRLGDEHVTARRGDFVALPHGQVHAFRNTGDGVARLLCTFTPAGIEDFFAETLARAEGDDAIAARHGLTFV